jgi:dTDP-4-dehydrorhamnose reductase
MGGDGVELVVGVDGMIGAALARRLQAAGRRVLGTSRRPDTSDGLFYLDLADPPATWLGPPVATAYLCAAVTRLEACRSDPVGSARVNVEGVVQLARLLANQGAYVVFLSTNHVFDGARPYRRPEEPTCPLNEYGRQKAGGEEQILKLGNSTAVLRLAKVLGERVPLFEAWTEALRNGECIRPYADLSMAPVPLVTVTQVLARLGEQRRAGIHHLSGNRDIAYAEIALLAGRLAGAEEMVRPVAAQEADPSAEPPPRHTTLDMAGLPARLGVSVPDVAATIYWRLVRQPGECVEPAQALRFPKTPAA